MAGHEGIGLDGLNALADDEVRAALAACCAAPGWVEALARARPFRSADELYDAAERVLADLDDAQVQAALAGHPRIGERPAGTTAADAWSRREQSAANGAAAGTLTALAEANRAYEQRFGHVYLVAASGKSADELLAILRHRLHNDPATERRVVRSELAKINRTRLARMIGP